MNKLWFGLILVCFTLSFIHLLDLEVAGVADEAELGGALGAAVHEGHDLRLLPLVLHTDL